MAHICGGSHTREDETSAYRPHPLPRRLALAVCLAALLGARAASAQSLNQAVCRLIERSAARYHIPVPFFTRLIWSESSFRAGAVSPVGAQGIAQFMPGTAVERGLADPFDPEQAIPKSAHLLADLARQFGNFGLAAAAYNAGPSRVSAWLAKTRGLPSETQAYVMQITGRPAQSWALQGAKPASPGAKPEPRPQTCLMVTASLRISGKKTSFAPAQNPWSPWGVQLAGAFSKAMALAQYRRTLKKYSRLIAPVRPMILGARLQSRGFRPFYRIRIPEPSRAAANAQCQKLRTAGGNCVVLHS